MENDPFIANLDGLARELQITRGYRASKLGSCVPGTPFDKESKCLREIQNTALQFIR